MGVIAGLLGQSEDTSSWAILSIGIIAWGFLQGTSIMLGYGSIPSDISTWTSVDKITLFLSLLLLLPTTLVGGIIARLVGKQIGQFKTRRTKNKTPRKVFSGSNCPQCQTTYKSNPRICYNCGYEFRKEPPGSQED
ncbi:MAG: hypothetical protein ACW976_07700 [Candidatus Ranarchaeia archaeon]|jgi:hypothetical protein